MKRLSRMERCCVVAIVLLAWALRWVLLLDAPPGWRDDDLIEIYTFSQRIVEEGPVLYFAGASGHEPLFHTIRAPLIALAGINQASARWLNAVAGTLTVLLTWAIGRRTVGRRAGLVAAALVAVSFWSLMYSRVAIRHIGTLPWALLAVYWTWRLLRGPKVQSRAVVGIAVGIGGAVLTYYAGRLVPVLLALAYPVLGPRKGRWRPYIVAIAVGVALAVPMFVVAAQMSGADARVSELAVPIHALLEGDPGPLLRTTGTTLGMAHARGDPEWLYNRSERPVFGPVGAALFYAGLAAALWHWRRPQSRLMLLWLAVAISPALVSLPPSSYGHTILAMPAAYLVLASLTELPSRGATSWRRPLRWLAAVAIVGVVALRDIPGYFTDWSRASMVGFLYRSDYRNLTRYLQENDEVRDLSVGSMLSGPWDKVAVNTDLLRQDARIRWMDPERALIFAGGAPTLTFLQDEGQRAAAIAALLEQSTTSVAPVGMQGYRIEPVAPSAGAVYTTVDGVKLEDSTFNDALTLQAVYLLPHSDAAHSDAAHSDAAQSDAPLTIITWWKVSTPLPLPAEELVPYPPPPGVYSGPRLSVFAHLMSGDTLLGIDDGLGVDPYTLLPEDVIFQVHTFAASWDGDSPLTLTLGLYDPLTGKRWTTTTGADSVTIRLAP